jgi:hypothetical protein
MCGVERTESRLQKAKVTLAGEFLRADDLLGTVAQSQPILLVRGTARIQQDAEKSRSAGQTALLSG